jgi:magnesium-transporting ATPase (P-type)
MTVTEIWAGNAHYRIRDGIIRLADMPATVGWALKEVLVAGALCNNGVDATELALLGAAKAGRLDEPTLSEVFPWLAEVAATPDHPVMATLHETAGKQVIYAKGPLDRLLPACVDMLDTHGRNWPLDAEDIVERAAVLAAQGMQVVALARKSYGGTKLCTAELNGGLTFIGMVGIAPS